MGKVYRLALFVFSMDDKIEVLGAPVTYSTEKPPPYNPLHRPKISYKKPIIFFILFVIEIALLALIPLDLPLGKWIIIAVFAVTYLALISKKAIIWLVHLYQSKASDKTRLRCLFEPSCSEYMILAVNKYGVIIGVAKGVKRLLRCHYPNGGVDYP